MNIEGNTRGEIFIAIRLTLVINIDHPNQIGSPLT